jgi:hypothetical protein
MNKVWLSAAILAGARAAAFGSPVAEKNVLDIVVSNGPLAGSYHQSDVICMHAQRQRVFSVAYKDFNPTGAKRFIEGGIEIRDPDIAGAKRATVSVTLGDPNKPTIYQISHEPVSFDLNGGRATIAFEGKTDSGVRIKVTAACLDVTTV